MCRLLLTVLILLSLTRIGRAQVNDSLLVKVESSDGQSLSNATVELLKTDSTLLKVLVSDSAGCITLKNVPQFSFLLRASRVGFKPVVIQHSPGPRETVRLVLFPISSTLQNLTVSASRSFLEMRPDKLIVHMDAMISNVGATALEALEKLPGVSVDKDGNISLKGRSGVMVMLDGKPTYLNGTELASLLSGMNASQISQIEIMDNPPARFDAAGNAGIINIKTKKNTQRGFNGTLTASYGQGYYPKSNNSLLLNYRNGRWNVFANYSPNYMGYFSRIYALRTYFEKDGKTILSLLEQPSFLSGNLTSHNLRTGIDFTISSNTSIGLTLTGATFLRDGKGANPAYWMKANRQIDSLVFTTSRSHTAWDNGGGSFYFRHNLSNTRELGADVDVLHYRIGSDQYFENISVIPGSYSEASRANIPTGIRILSAKADYMEQLKNLRLEGGWKSSNITTDNESINQYRAAGGWTDDWGRSNHFLYNENIHALYGSAQAELDKWNLQGGLRFEMTNYDARQLGNILVKDSSFSRTYNSLFPSLFVSYEKDSAHTFSFRTSRRIDRPAFQKLNPFLFIINKYTYQRGNPFYRPQYTWNFELSHFYKNRLLTAISYSSTTDYFSQIFPIDTNGIVVYTEGNLGRLQNFGLSAGLQLTVAPWWNTSIQTAVNHKRMEGVINGKMTAAITQYTVNVNNQFRFKNGWSGELTGFYNSRSQHDIQEVVDPAGQVSLGISKSVWQNKATVKLAVRDVFYTNWMKGLTQFSNATEYFKLTRDTRVGTISFTWRFGKSFKTNKRSDGAAGDEIQRVGNG